MKPLSLIRYIKIKTFITSRAAQNVLKTSHAAGHWFQLLQQSGKTNLMLSIIFLHVYNAFIDPTTSLGNKSIGTWRFMHQDMH